MFRPLPIPPYPGVIPYTVDQAGEASKGSSGGSEELSSSPRLLGIEHRPVSVGSFGPPSTGTVPGLRTGTLSEEQVRDKFYAYWTRQKVSYCLSPPQRDGCSPHLVELPAILLCFVRPSRAGRSLDK